MLKRIFFILTLFVVIIFYQDIGWDMEKEQNDDFVSSSPKELSIQEDSFPEYRFLIQMESTYEIKAELDIKYPNNTGNPLDEVKILLPANILYGDRYIEIKRLEILNSHFSLMQSDEEIVVIFKDKLMPGETAEIKLDFSTVLPLQAGIFGLYQGVMRLSSWHPVIAPYDKERESWSDFEKASFGDPYFFEAARYYGNISVPAQWQLISPFATEMNGADRVHAYSFDSVFPARDCTFVIGTGFKQSQQKLGTVMIEYYFRGQDRGFSREGAEILDFFSSWLGEYPYPKLVVVDLPLNENLGMEFSGMVFLSSSSAQIGLQTLAHEIAHQYWYGIVGTHQINEPWVDEGLASYCALLYLEKKFGGEAYYPHIENISLKYSYISFLPISSYPNKEVYKEAVYTRPILFWHQMRDLGGKDRLFQVLGQIQKDYRFRVMSGENLLSALKQEYGLNNHELRLMLLDKKFRNH